MNKGTHCIEQACVFKERACVLYEWVDVHIERVYAFFEAFVTFMTPNAH